MKNSLKLALCALLLTAPGLFPTGAHAQTTNAPAPTLAVGDDAPTISVAGWWNKKVLETPEKGTVYVVDFWASWCGPCRASMPHLFEMQQKYGEQGAKFAGISIDQDKDAAIQYLNTLGADLPIYFGLDEAGKSWKSWGRAAGRTGIPSTFIIGKDGKIAWIGHPMQAEEPLKAALAQ